MTGLISLPYQTWGPVLFIFARVVAMFAAAPFTGAPLLPPTLRVLLGIVIGFFALSAGVPVALPPESMWPLTLLAQLLIGTVLGALATLIFALFHSTGAILDTELGFTVAQEFNPFAAAGQSSLLANWFDMMGTLVFLMLGGAQLLIVSAVQSFRVVPINVIVLNVGRSFTAAVLDAFFKSILLAVELAAPVLLALLLVDLIGAALGRLLPQLNVLTFNLPAKMWLGMGLIGLMLPIMVGAGRVALGLLSRDIAAAMHGV